MRWFMLIVLAIFLLGVTLVMYAQTESDLPVIRNAPELHDGIWLNTETPLKLANLRGKVVLLEMWTFDCINCIRTLPYVQEWHETYSEDGLVVIGNHYPEFNYEHELPNLRAAIQRLGVTYPILQDNDRQTWSAYNNRFWPTIYLIDKRGQVRYVHFGEGRYSTTEQNIQALLAEPYPDEDEAASDTIPIYSLTPTEPLNVRSGSGINHNRIGLIMPNEAYYILGEENGWYRILFDGERAYVSGEYVTITNTEESTTN